MFSKYYITVDRSSKLLKHELRKMLVQKKKKINSLRLREAIIINVCFSLDNVKTGEWKGGGVPM